MNIVIIFITYMSISNWLLWFTLGVGSGLVVVNMSTSLLLGLGGGFLIFALFMLLGSIDHFFSPVKKRMSKN